MTSPQLSLRCSLADSLLASEGIKAPQRYSLVGHTSQKVQIFYSLVKVLCQQLLTFGNFCYTIFLPGIKLIVLDARSSSCTD